MALPQYPATGLQVSLENNDQSIFLERLTSRDIITDESNPGVLSFRIPKAEVPRFNRRNRDPLNSTTAVKVHAWQGEKWLGSWDVGTLGEQDAFTEVA